MKKIKPLALYLPQYHPTDLNDKWWGKGFTEWTNVTKAKSLYDGHQQPLLAGDLGYYDLRLPEIREQQANLAREYGVYGFIYYHYWFGNEVQTLERIANEVLESGKPDFPFCFCWANETWTGIWHGLSNEIIAEQVYPEGDVEKHFDYLLPFFEDDRYIKIDNCPVFIVYDPIHLNENNNTYLSILRKLAQNNGFEGLHIIAGNKLEDELDYKSLNYQGKITDAFKKSWVKEIQKNANINQSITTKEYYKNRIKGFFGLQNKLSVKKFVNQQDMSEIVKNLKFTETEIPTYPCIMPNWDNTPRSGTNGIVINNATSENFKKQIEKAKEYFEDKNYPENFLIIKSWNEWAEGNIMEPDRNNKHAFLETLKKTLEQ
ncbi:glycosyltransferase WbsX family protein [Empedobacter falsenii]